MAGCSLLPIGNPDFVPQTFEFFQIEIVLLEVEEGGVDKPSYQRNPGKGRKGKRAVRITVWYVDFHFILSVCLCLVSASVESLFVSSGNKLPIFCVGGREGYWLLWDGSGDLLGRLLTSAFRLPFSYPHPNSLINSIVFKIWINLIYLFTIY